ncbi:farnesyl diphosphate synthase [Bathymodiolus platifrons methanotrophic gill symbiont]|uniref:(2E,6E)-farnesyl diphosphate synthase n=2 Tax=Bathymodiolus platifrons methanotrophic gill symbiont TaxID=113268 RepID=UPI000B4211EB|nr:farnesyl diphosphate synthase [Bathymodiolus platifrons methanotrophic gill symbiont]MCK5869511.1 (2E,6E)-farnesyl diphosphate synthase [Methyloprofundus sp.]TXK93329.1 (2E,6E)-farnesyl diphosphate synthase [Methylococcaceae bacterium CS4]TXK98716.1 (2E,6E)-farnesyl diphosphate synthase [Methylococcaceae bacterium CS5]TXL02525.1 (2E,6E)-farnesyl diphosphate synthase [Methylococcaceae bacterium CS1]TXL03004.1 (2E,6E)-farnesyl diphosphate synthase [Methylococcaceae bacterium CS2]TXL07348.1 (
MSNALKEYLVTSQERVEKALDLRLPANTILPRKLHDAMRYSTLDGGKRMRPMLTYSAGKALGIAPESLDGPACAVEMIHVYSLIHDDLPAMDDDDLRRGKATSHVAYDEATAILAGDALQALAFQVLANDSSMNASAESRIQMINALTKASGSLGMVGGQAIDLESVGKKLTLPELENMHIHKTGALIRVSVQLATLSKPDLDPATASKLDHYAKCIGLSFQVKDDILDEESDTATLGKTQGKDQDNDKPTYPALLGLAGAKQKAQDLHEQAVESLAGFGAEADLLRDLSLYIIQRDH